MELDRHDERPDVLMNVRDKDDINKFSAHLTRRNDLRARIARKKKLIEVHEDAADELIIMDDDDQVYYNVGDVFIMDTKTSVDTVLERTKEEVTREVAVHEDELATIESEMVTLKASLYAKFGKVRFFFFYYSIYLSSFNLPSH